MKSLFNFLSYDKELGRLGYFIFNSIVTIFAFEYLYLPFLAKSVLIILHKPEYKMVLDLVKSEAHYAEQLKWLQNISAPTQSSYLIKYSFVVLLRYIDLKRVKDILGRKLKTIEVLMIFFIFSIPFVEFISAIVLMIYPSKFKNQNKHS